MRTSLTHFWLINLSQGKPVFDLRASLTRENDRGDRIRALQQQPRDDQALDAPQLLAAKQPWLAHASAGSASSSWAPSSTDIGPIRRIG